MSATIMMARYVHTFRRRGFGLLLALAIQMAGGCAVGPSLVFHSFGFNVLRDSPDVELLDYRYGDTKTPGARPDTGEYARGEIRQRTGVAGAMLRGDVLYAKWRNKMDGRIYEETVDLRSRLPDEIHNHIVYFMIGGPRNSELFVYLVSPEQRPPDIAPNGPRIYRYNKVITIYPDGGATRPGSGTRSEK